MAKSLAGIVACCSLLLPVYAHAASAQSIPAGFAPSSIFASETDIAAGDSVTLFTVLYNSSLDNVSGDVNFTVDGASIGTKQFSLSAGQTQTESIAWTATSGTHKASATLENAVSSSGMGTPFANASAGTVILTVAPPPPPSPVAAAAQNALAVANAVASSATPFIDQAATTLEHIRQAGAQYLASQLETGRSPSPAKPAGMVLGASTSTVQSAAAASSGALSALWRAILTGAYYVFKIQVLFYLMLLFVLYVLYKTVRGFFAYRVRAR